MATATYPPPPPYYRLYKDYLQNSSSAPEPPPPIEGTYICFGGNYTVTFLFYLINARIWKVKFSFGSKIFGTFMYLLGFFWLFVD